MEGVTQSLEELRKINDEEILTDKTEDERKTAQESFRVIRKAKYIRRSPID